MPGESLFSCKGASTINWYSKLIETPMYRLPQLVCKTGSRDAPLLTCQFSDFAQHEGSRHLLANILHVRDNKEFMFGACDGDVQQAHRLGSPAFSQKRRDHQAWRLHNVKDEGIELEPLVGMHGANSTIDLQVCPLNPLFDTVTLRCIGRHDSDVLRFAALIGEVGENLLGQRNINSGMILVISRPASFLRPLCQSQWLAAHIVEYDRVIGLRLEGRPPCMGVAVFEESFVDGFTHQVTDVGMHTALVRQEYTMMRTRARLVECVLAMSVHIHTQPEPNQLLLIGELTYGCQLVRVADYNEVAFGAIARNDHRWGRPHRSLIHDHDIPFLIQKMRVEVETGQSGRDYLRFLNHLAGHLTLSFRELLIEMGQGLFKQGHFLFCGSNGLFDLSNVRIADR